MPDVITMEPEKPEKKSSRLLFFLIVVLVAFLLGFIPMWMKARDQSTVREKAEHELTLTRIVKDLGSAAIDARRAEYEAARQEASAFFTAAHFEIDQQLAFDNVEKFVIVSMFVPVIFALHNAKANDGAVHLTERLVVPLVGASIGERSFVDHFQRLAKEVEARFVLEAFHIGH